MPEPTCKTCPWCDVGQSDKRDAFMDLAPCRLNGPRAATDELLMLPYAEWPWVRMSDDWCGEHPDRQPHLDCSATTTFVTHDDDGPSAADMRRIVDALEKMATCAAVKP